MLGYGKWVFAKSHSSLALHVTHVTSAAKQNPEIEQWAGPQKKEGRSWKTRPACTAGFLSGERVPVPVYKKNTPLPSTDFMGRMNRRRQTISLN